MVMHRMSAEHMVDAKCRGSMLGSMQWALQTPHLKGRDLATHSRTRQARGSIMKLT